MLVESVDAPLLIPPSPLQQPPPLLPRSITLHDHATNIEEIARLSLLEQCLDDDNEESNGHDRVGYLHFQPSCSGIREWCHTNNQLQTAQTYGALKNDSHFSSSAIVTRMTISSTPTQNNNDDHTLNDDTFTANNSLPPHRRFTKRLRIHRSVGGRNEQNDLKNQHQQYSSYNSNNFESSHHWEQRTADQQQPPPSASGSLCSSQFSSKVQSIIVTSEGFHPHKLSRVSTPSTTKKKIVNSANSNIVSRVSENILLNYKEDESYKKGQIIFESRQYKSGDYMSPRSKLPRINVISSSSLKRNDDSARICSDESDKQRNSLGFVIDTYHDYSNVTSQRSSIKRIEDNDSSKLSAALRLSSSRQQDSLNSERGGSGSSHQEIFSPPPPSHRTTSQFISKSSSQRTTTDQFLNELNIQYIDSNSFIATKGAWWGSLKGSPVLRQKKRKRHAISFLEEKKKIDRDQSEESSPSQQLQQLHQQQQQYKQRFSTREFLASQLKENNRLVLKETTENLSIATPMHSSSDSKKLEDMMLTSDRSILALSHLQQQQQQQHRTSRTRSVPKHHYPISSTSNNHRKTTAEQSESHITKDLESLLCPGSLVGLNNYKITYKTKQHDSSLLSGLLRTTRFNTTDHFKEDKEQQQQIEFEQQEQNYSLKNKVIKDKFVFVSQQQKREGSSSTSNNKVRILDAKQLQLLLPSSSSSSQEQQQLPSHVRQPVSTNIQMQAVIDQHFKPLPRLVSNQNKKQR